MNVKELREKLAELPDDAPLFVSGYEGGVNDLECIEACKVKLNAHTEWYYGSHEPESGDGDWNAEGFTLT